MGSVASLLQESALTSSHDGSEKAAPHAEPIWQAVGRPILARRRCASQPKLPPVGCADLLTLTSVSTALVGMKPSPPTVPATHRVPRPSPLRPVDMNTRFSPPRTDAVPVVAQQFQPHPPSENSLSNSFGSPNLPLPPT
eukprot:EG_transcript_44136